MPIKITLNETLERDGCKLTKNAIAVEAKIRPGTLSDLVNGKSKGVTFDTIEKVIDAMNRLDPSGHYKLTDVFDYVNEE
ncbi:helix-turn-helix domain-containing protein [Solibacillus sp. FSL K6-1126]|uniref:helix-turn-helix domain-containing protein n=1 Tax=Solibacillus sp. FSL K6-1126 TaxID=2921463 RepID=UPI0030F71054